MADTSWSKSIQPVHIGRFFDQLPDRLPGGPNAQEALERIGRATARLNAVMLGRELDERVPRDIEALSDQVASRARRYTSDDWSRTYAGESVLDWARELIALISSDLRGQGDDEDDPWATPGPDDQ